MNIKELTLARHRRYNVSRGVLGISNETGINGTADCGINNPESPANRTIVFDERLRFQICTVSRCLHATWYLIVNSIGIKHNFMPRNHHEINQMEMY